MNKLFISVTCLCTFLITGCGYNQAESERTNMEVTATSNTSQTQQQKEEKAENIALQFPEMKQAKAISSNGEMIVAIQVKQMQKFFTESIEKKVKEQLKKEFPEKEKIYVSHDLKIWFEVQKLDRARQENNLDSKEIEKRFKKLNKLRKEKT
ncbi:MULTISPECIES: YhcN/YlaJ family sporulation lipoprotein [Bacillus]|uniref:YhcN/YlaJ family sporulation lipoprotein n=1 Tax=Bacillus TaxID=1386 RepID=UPI000BB78001|nr:MULTISPECIES: YhcN/YlaJ family sporulation lipoprotein [Bacillus]